MRVCKYVTFLRSDRAQYAYNAINGGLCELAQNIYKELKAGDCRAVEATDTKVYDELKKTLYVVPDDFDEVAYVKWMTWNSKTNKDSFSLTIAPTLDCNFRCFYCYEQDYHKQEYMTRAAADDLIEFVKHHVSQKEKIWITWYGGEPLLALDTIRYVSQGLKKIITPPSTKKGVKEEKQKIASRLYAGVVTNGYLLTKDVAQILAQECNVESIQVTLDGPRRIHDKRRPCLSGTSSYDAIMANIQNSAMYFHKVSVRINVDRENEKDIPELLNALKSMPTNVKPYVAPVHMDNVTHPGFAYSCYDSKEFSERTMRDAAIAPLIPYPQPNYGACAAVCGNSFGVDPAGRLYKCWDEIGMPERAVGTVKDGVTNYPRYLKWVTFDPTAIAACRKCYILPICNAGNCPDRILFPEENGTAAQCIPERWVLKKSLQNYLARKTEEEKA